MWLLTGAPGASARVESGGSKLSADRVEVDRPRQQVRGDGGARAVFAPDPKEKKPAPVSFVGDRKRPTYGKADRIVLDDAAKVATLTGKASLWQDDSSLFADSITLSDAEKTVVAVQNVRAAARAVAIEGTRQASGGARRLGRHFASGCATATAIAARASRTASR